MLNFIEIFRMMEVNPATNPSGFLSGVTFIILHIIILLLLLLLCTSNRIKMCNVNVEGDDRNHDATLDDRLPHACYREYAAHVRRTATHR